MKNTSHQVKAQGTIKLGGDVSQVTVKRGDNAIAYLIAIYATLISISTALISILPICECLRIVLIVTAVVSLYIFTLRSQAGRKFFMKELHRLHEVEETYK